MTNVVSVTFVNVKAFTLFFLFFLLFFSFFSLNNSFYLTNQQLVSFFLLLHRLYGSSFCLLFWDLLRLSCKCRWCYSTHTHTHHGFSDMVAQRKVTWVESFHYCFTFVARLWDFLKERTVASVFCLFIFLNLPASLYTLLQRSCCVCSVKSIYWDIAFL